MNKVFKIIIIVLVAFSFKESFSQGDSSGLYKNTDDFIKGFLSYAGKHTQIKTFAFFKKNVIKIRYHDTIYSYLKKDVYGYKDKSGNIYRFFDNEIYLIVNPKEKIILYKTTKGTGLKNSPVTETWYFSKDAGAEILLLTQANIEMSFSDVPQFEKIIEIYCKTDDDLFEYDYTFNMYKINRLLELSAN